MHNLTVKIPKTETVYIAFSGGVDSLAAAHFYRKMNMDVQLLHFNHGCEYSNNIEKGCVELAKQLNLPIIVGYNDSLPKPNQSVEDAWRRSRYRFLYSQVPENGYLVTAHHLNDSVETWIFSSLHGNGKIIEPLQEIEFDGKKFKLVRPFLMNNKEKLTKCLVNTGLECVKDECNFDNSLSRNYIRNVMMEHVLFINPGLEKVIKKKYLKLLGRM